MAPTERGIDLGVVGCAGRGGASRHCPPATENRRDLPILNEQQRGQAPGFVASRSLRLEMRSTVCTRDALGQVQVLQRMARQLGSGCYFAARPAVSERLAVEDLFDGRPSRQPREARLYPAFPPDFACPARSACTVMSQPDVLRIRLGWAGSRECGTPEVLRGSLSRGNSPEEETVTLSNLHQNIVDFNSR